MCHPVPAPELVPGSTPPATLYDCAGVWDAGAGTYRERLVVRAANIAPADPGDVPAHPSS